MKKLLFLLFACSPTVNWYSGGISAQKSSGIKSKAIKPAKKRVVKYGLASYYAKKFRGRQTSNGAKYNSAKFTAACNVLPLGTWVKVTNLNNKKAVVVQINDHLHHRTKRLIDLSRSAAQKLGFISHGIIKVKVEVVNKASRLNYKRAKIS